MQKFSSVLLVDDDTTTNFLHQLLFKRLDMADEVLVALNGQEALDLLRTHCPPVTAANPVLVLLDVKMPVMDGFAFLDAYKNLGLMQQGSTIIMLSTSLHPHDVERVRQLPIAGFLNKPLTEAKLRTILEPKLPAL